MLSIFSKEGRVLFTIIEGLYQFNVYYLIPKDEALYSAYKKNYVILYKWPMIGQYTDRIIICRPV